MFMVLLAIILRGGKHTNSSHDSFNNPLYVPKFAKLHHSNSSFVNLFLLLVTIMREEERLIFMLLCYLKCNLLIITCIGYHNIIVIYSYIKCQCIGKDLDLKVNGLMFCGVLFMLLKICEITLPTVFYLLV